MYSNVSLAQSDRATILRKYWINWRLRSIFKLHNLDIQMQFVTIGCRIGSGIKCGGHIFFVLWHAFGHQLWLNSCSVHNTMPKKWLFFVIFNLMVFQLTNVIAMIKEGSRCAPEGSLAPNPSDCTSYLICDHGKYVLRW